MRRLLVPILAFTFVAAACGSDDDGATNDTVAESEVSETSVPAGETDESATTEPADDTDESATTEPSVGESEAPEGDPIKVGVITPLAGPLGIYGESVNQAVQYAIDEVNEAGGVLGRPVEGIYVETDGSPENTIQNAERLVRQDGVGFLTGPITSAEVLALNPRLENLGAMFMNMTSKSNRVTGEDCSALAFQITSNDGMDLAAMSSAIADSGANTWAAVANDFAIGYDSIASFTASAEGAGQAVVQPLYAPLGTADYGTYITQLQQSGADALWVTLIGGDAATFMTQASQFGLFDDFDVVMGTNTVTEPLFPALGDYTAGFVGPFSYYRDSVDTPANVDFVAGWSDTYGDLPYFVDADTYTGMQTLFQAIEAAGSDDPFAVADALGGLEVETIFGPVTMRAEDHQLLRPTFVGEIVVTDDGLAWNVLSQADAETTSPEPNADCSL